jgi:uncharacterized phage-associated protein
MSEDRYSLEDSIAMVAAQAKHQGVVLTRTKLVKLLYFLDVRAWDTIGRTVTGVEWIWHHYGPYSSTVVEVCDAMAETGELEVEETANYFGKPEYRIHSVSEAYYYRHSAVFGSLVRQVVHDYGRFSPAAVGDKSYETEPMRRVVRDGQRGDVIEFPITPGTKTDVARTAARYAALARKTRGEDEGDIASGLREEGQALSGARASAMDRMFSDR